METRMRTSSSASIIAQATRPSNSFLLGPPRTLTSVSSRGLSSPSFFRVTSAFFDCLPLSTTTAFLLLLVFAARFFNARSIAQLSSFCCGFCAAWCC